MTNLHTFASIDNIYAPLTSLYASVNACAGVSCANGGSCRLDPDDGSALCCCATGFTGANCTVSGNISYIKRCSINEGVKMYKQISMKHNQVFV